MLNLTAFLIIIVSLTVIIIILSRKFPLLKHIELELVDREKKAKYLLVEQRLKRNIDKIKERIKLNSLIQNGSKVIDNVKSFVQILDSAKKEYLSRLKNAKRKKNETGAPPNDQSVNDERLAAIRQLVQQNNLEDAEKMIFELIKNDPKNLEAYKMLGDMYFDKKNFVHAEATLEHILQLGQRLKKIKALDYLQLAKVKLLLDKADEALQIAKKAVSLEPSNPKILHFLTKICILTRQKDLAWKYYIRLKKINGENSGLDDLLEELKKL